MLVVNQPAKRWEANDSQALPADGGKVLILPKK
jgi:hypothetical protein